MYRNINIDINTNINIQEKVKEKMEILRIMKYYKKIKMKN